MYYFKSKDNLTIHALATPDLRDDKGYIEITKEDFDDLIRGTERK